MEKSIFNIPPPGTRASKVVQAVPHAKKPKKEITEKKNDQK